MSFLGYVMAGAGVTLGALVVIFVALLALGLFDKGKELVALARVLRKGRENG